MTAHSRFRIAAALGALIAPLALVAAATAPADAATSKHKHEVYMYKVEKDLRLAGVGPNAIGQSGTTSLSCFGTDNVLDGMWNVKHVDQYQDPEFDPDDDPEYPSTVTLGGLYNDERDVFVQASYPDTGNVAKWNFRFQNRAYGDAQLKIFVTCIRDFTEKTNGYKHEVDVSGAGYYTRPTVGHNQAWAGRTMYDGTSDLWCPDVNDLFVAPGFDLVGTTRDHRLVASYPTQSGRSWAWEFASFDPDPLGAGTGPIVTGQNVNFYGKCIDRRVLDSGAGHRHAIVMKHLPGPTWGSPWQNNGWHELIGQGDAQEVQYSCDTDHWEYSGYKAAVGWFFIYTGWEHTWFYGSEPRPKTRVWQFWNGHPVSADVSLGALCINSRTANPIVT